MKKGLFFSIDALFGISVLIILFGSLTLIALTEPTLGLEQSILYNNATDEALEAYLTNGGNDPNPSPTIEQVNCKEFYNYNFASGSVDVKVKKCFP